jgi:outer membrane protein assembly factor BamB
MRNLVLLALLAGCGGDPSIETTTEALTCPPPSPGGIADGDFEAQGLGPWIATGSVTLDAPHTGLHGALLSTTSTNYGATPATLLQSFTVPATGKTQLAYWWSPLECAGAVHGAHQWVELLQAGKVVVSLSSTCVRGGSWALVQRDVSAYAGQTLALRFTVADPTGASTGVSLAVDDVAVSNYAPPAVRFTAPADPSLLGLTVVTAQATASPCTTLAQPMQFFWNGQVLATGALDSVSASFLGPGVVTARAYDSAGNVGEASLALTRKGEWSMPIGQGASHVALAGSNAVVVAGNLLSSFDATSGRPQFTLTTSGSVPNRLATGVLKDGSPAAFYISSSGDLPRINPVNGAINWRVNVEDLSCPSLGQGTPSPTLLTKAAVNAGNRAAIADDLVIAPGPVSCTRWGVRALYAGTGGTAWTFNFPTNASTYGFGRVADACVYDDGQNLLYCAADAGPSYPRLWVIDVVTGALRTSLSLEPAAVRPVVDTAGQRVYVVGQSGALYAIDQTPALHVAWSLPLATTFASGFWAEPRSAANASAGMLFLVDTKGTLFAVQDQGAQAIVKWQSTGREETGHFVSRPVLAGATGLVYAGGSTGTVVAVDAATGTVSHWVTLAQGPGDPELATIASAPAGPDQILVPFSSGTLGAWQLPLD